MINGHTRRVSPIQDPHNLYLVMDFHPGGDLLTVMERHDGGMSEDEARYVWVRRVYGYIA